MELKVWLWQFLMMCNGEKQSFVGIDRLTPVETPEKEDEASLIEDIIVFFCRVIDKDDGFEIL